MLYMNNLLIQINLYQKSLDEKWLIIQEKYNSFLDSIYYLDCAFCIDCNIHCDNCKIDKRICDENGYSGYHDQFRKLILDLNSRIDLICRELKSAVNGNILI